MNELISTNIFRKALITGLVAAAGVSGAQVQGVEYTEYLGDIVVDAPVLPLAADAAGHLFYGTFDGPDSKLYVIESPEAEVNVPTAATNLIRDFTEFPAQRGLQSIQVTSENALLVAGDTGDANAANVWKLNWDGPGSGLDYTLDTAFTANAVLHPARRSAVSIYSDSAGDGVMIVNGLNDMDFFDFDGVHLSGPFRVSDNYMRESVFNSIDDVFYVIRNGEGTQELIRNYVTNVDPDVAGGGTLTTSTLISDGGSNGKFGGARQNAYYYEALNQLITMDGDVVIGGDPVPPTVRVWDILDSGTSLSLAYSIEQTTETSPLESTGDAVIINNRLYVSSTGTGRIYVFSPAPAAVKKWGRFEDVDLFREE